MKKKLLFILIAMLPLVACEIEKVIDYKTYYGGDQIVVHAYLTDSDGLIAAVHKTVPPATPQADNKIADAQVWLLANGSKFAQAQTENGEDYYISPDALTLDNETRYSIVVESQTHGVATSAETIMPPPVKLDSLHIDGSMAQLHFRNPSPAMAYAVRTRTYDRGEERRSDWITQLYPDYKTGLSAGECVIEQSHYISFYDDSVKYELVVLTPELVELFDSRDKYLDSYRDPYFEIIYPMISNIEGGCGFFGAYRSSAVMWRVEK